MSTDVDQDALLFRSVYFFAVCLLHLRLEFWFFAYRSYVVAVAWRWIYVVKTPC